MASHLRPGSRSGIDRVSFLYWQQSAQREPRTHTTTEGTTRGGGGDKNGRLCKNCLFLEGVEPSTFAFLVILSRGSEII